jgi:hypothetical protein
VDGEEERGEGGSSKEKERSGPEGGANTGVKAGVRASEAKVADGTLLARVAALEKKLEEQMRGEKKRVEDAYGKRMADQGRKSRLILEEMKERNEEKERRRMWEREEERRKSAEGGKKTTGD